MNLDGDGSLEASKLTQSIESSPILAKLNSVLSKRLIHFDTQNDSDIEKDPNQA